MSDKIEHIIKESPLFKHLSEEDLNSLIDASALRTYEMGDVIIEEGGNVENLFIVLRGRVRVWTNGPRGQVDLKQMGPGAYFGEVSLMSGNSATATVAVNLGPAEVVAIPRADLLEIIESDEKIRKMLQGVTLARAKDTIGKVFK